MAGLYSGKRTRTEHDLAENNDRNKRRNSGTGREQTMPGADSTVYRILCPSNVIGSVIGKGGKVIKSMRQETRSKIRVADAVPGVDERVIVIFSSPLSKDKEKDDDDDDNENEPVCPAQDGLLRVHSVIVQESSGKDNDADKKRPQDARLLVANSQIGSLIGKGGNNIQKLRSESGAQIQIPRKDELPGCAFSFDELVVISGDAAAVKKALYAVSAFLFKHPPKEQIPWSVILPETNQSSLPPSGVPAFPPANYLPQGDSLFGHHNLSAPILGYASRLPGLGGYGSEAGSAWPLSNPALPTFSKFGNSAAKKTSEEFSIRVLCPNDKIGGVIGKGGNTIKSMRKDTGASIRVEDAQTESDERVIVVSATELADDRVSPTIEAVLLLQGKTSGTTDKDGAISTRFLVPSKHIGCLLGKGGNIISEMRKQTRANIRIFRKDERPICVSENEELVQAALGSSVEKTELSRRDFPSDFIFGVASSAYQFEGGYLDDGKGLSNWDVFSHIPGRIADAKNGDVAEDEYHRYKEDVELMSELGVDSYRFSISWARIFPEGRGEINLGGVEYYNELIDSLLTRGIQPFVTLCHYDIPQALEDLYGGWLSPNIVDDFTGYAEACFRNFGGRVKYWSTFNEPNSFIPRGYDTGEYPPGRCSAVFGACRAGNSSTEPYIAAHNILRAHASAVHLYRKGYQPHQQGFIGIVMSCTWYEPLLNNSQDISAIQRLLDFSIGWYLDPIVFGEYPAIMQELVGTRLPTITSELREKLRGSYDFIGVNYYSTRYGADASYYLNYSYRRYSWDSLAISTGERNGIPIGPQMWPPYMYGVPYGVREMVDYLQRRYSNPTIFITENGFGNARNGSIPLSQIRNDTFRVDYLESTLYYLKKAMRGGADVRGYFVWSVLDNFEWIYGYTSMFGLYYVDFTNELRRCPKLSGKWYRNFLQDGRSSSR